MNFRQFTYSSAFALGALVLSLGVQAGAQTFTPPSGSPPNSNAYAPLNTGPFDQVKSATGSAGQRGQLTLNGTLQVVNQNSANLGVYLQNGRMQVGATPDGTTVTGTVGLALFGKQVRIVDGTEGAGKVLTSDANGLASWGAPGGGSGLCKGATGTELPEGYGCAMLPNGAKMQWGRNAYLGVQEFVFLSPFANTNYAVTITPENTTSEDCVPTITTKSISNAKFSTDDRCSNYWYNYIAVGY